MRRVRRDMERTAVVGWLWERRWSRVAARACWVFSLSIGIDAS